MIRPPPPVLSSAHVLAYAALDGSVRWTAVQRLFVGEELLGPVPRLAIARDLFGNVEGVLIFHCDRRWNVLGVSGGPTVRECKASAERAYAGVSARWVPTGIRRREALRWYRDRFAPSACSWCRRLPPETAGMFRRRGINLCVDCVQALHTVLSTSGVVGDA